jgi:hypothetical protein
MRVLADSLDREKLPIGNYLIVTVVGNELLFNTYCRSDLQLATINNDRRVQLELRNRYGNYLDNASIWIDDKTAQYSHETKSYWITQKKPDDAIVKVAVAGDTLIAKLSRSNRKIESGWSQWWTNFRYTGVGKVITWPIISVRNIFKSEYDKIYRERKKRSGYMVFNKTEYKPQDTVRFKAYLLNKKGKRYTQPFDVYLQDNNNGRRYFLGTLKSASAGAYIHEFVLGDSLRSDMTYQVIFKDRNKTTVFTDEFRIEDYLLDEVSSYYLSASKENYFRNDTIVITASARDANGLAVMDGRVKLYATTRFIQDFYASRIYVPDTLWKEEKNLAVNGDTKFEIPLKDLPAADLAITIKAEFLNSNNELKEKTEDVYFKNSPVALDVVQDKNWIKATHTVDGRPGGKGWLKKTNIVRPIPVVFPYSEKVDPYTEEYNFYILDEKGKTVASHRHTPLYYNLHADKINNEDTVGFTIDNSYKIPVHYTVYDGTRVIATGGDSTEAITWTDVLPLKKQYYYEIQYMWAGEEQFTYGRIGVRDQEMETAIKGAAMIYPGQTDTITISVKDYKDRPAADVNLTAVSFNSQLKHWRFPDPPDLKKYKSKSGIEKPEYEVTETGLSNKELLGKYPGWRDKFGLDSMTYYKLLFPENGYHVAHTSISNFMPQVSVHVVKQGVPQKIEILYINRQPVYYDLSTDQSKYAFSVYPGYTQVIIRLRDRQIEIDSVYIQPFYKHDVSFDLDRLPAHSIVKEKPNWFTYDEKKMIESTTMVLRDNDRYDRFAFIWQNDRVVMTGDDWFHFIGPFSQYDSIHYYKPFQFDLKAPFEPGYMYLFSPGVARLEKERLFKTKKKVRFSRFANRWIIGDTLLNPPVINYDHKEQIVLKLTGNPFIANEKGKINIKIPDDSTFIYGVLHRLDPAKDTSNIFQDPKENDIYASPGMYELILVTENSSFLVYSDIRVKAGQTFCIWNRPPQYTKTNPVIDRLVAEYKAELNRINDASQFRDSLGRSFTHSIIPGMGRIMGRVVDPVGGAAVPFASVSLKGYNSYRMTNQNGEFVYDSIRAGNYVIQVSCIGYTNKEIWIEALPVPLYHTITLDYQATKIQNVMIRGAGSTRRNYRRGNFSAYVPLGSERRMLSPTFRKNGLKRGEVSYSDVIVTGYGSRRKGKRDSDGGDGPYDEDTPSNMSGEFYVYGNAVDRNEDVMAEWSNIPVRARMNFQRDLNPDARWISPTAPAADSAKVDRGKDLRDQFRDYAIWQPNLFTNESGNVQFTVTYPDNITSWQTYVVGMDKKNRFTTGKSRVKSFKPLLAQLASPQFLIEGDSVTLIGKTTNYSATDNAVRNEFTFNGIKQGSTDKQVKANSSAIEELFITATTPDTISAQYTVVNTEGFKDGELRKIPVFRKGIDETIGSFWILERDTAFSFIPERNASKITIHAQNNTLDVLLDEINELKKYPYFCMEQMASKITGLLMEKKIRQALDQPFKHEKDLVSLLSKLQKSQTYDGGWGWWPGGEPNLTITNYVTRALLTVRNYPLVETNIRNAMLYLRNQLNKGNRQERLATLYTMSEAGHETGYAYELNMLSFDSLTIHEQWQYIRIKQNAKLDYKKELDIVMKKQIGTMLGGLHWGEDNYWWDRNMMATTVLAFQTLENDKSRENELKRIIQFFLEYRKKGHWTNTVESASIVSTILPTILKNNASFTTPASLRINNSVTATKFPFTTTIAATDATVNINKSGGGLLYCTAYQEIFNTKPLPVTDKFNITTSFVRSGNNLATLQGGEKVMMKVDVQVISDADYVQIEIPIPAGCTYGVKLNKGKNLHTEYLKNKVVIFVEKMAKGQYNYEIELEPRYTGTYTLNPAKAELMYFPVFYGRNEIKEITVKK